MRSRQSLAFITILLLTVLTLGGASNAEIPGDINADGKVDLHESIHSLQVIAGIRPPVPAGMQVETYWPMHPGDTWTYQIAGGGTQTNSVSTTPEVVNGVSTTRFNYGNSYDCYSLDSEGLWIHKSSSGSNYLINSPPTQISPRQLAVSDHLISDMAGSAVIGGGSFPLDGEFMIAVSSFETVTVPAGTFVNCLKFVRSSYKKITDGGGNIIYIDSYVDVSWSAPDVGMIKQFRKSLDSGTWDVELITATVDGVTYGN